MVHHTVLGILNTKSNALQPSFYIALFIQLPCQAQQLGFRLVLPVWQQIKALLMGRRIYSDQTTACSFLCGCLTINAFICVCVNTDGKYVGRCGCVCVRVLKVKSCFC